MAPDVEVCIVSLSDWIVLALGVLAIAWVNWYFFLAEKTPAPHESQDARQSGER